MTDTLTAIREYRDGDVHYPFFAAVDTADEYRTTKDHLPEIGADIVRLSEFCGTEDVEPDIDALISWLRNVRRFIALLGVGEYLSLAGRSRTEGVLSRIRDLALNGNGGKVVIIYRGCHEILKAFKRHDVRFDNRRVWMESNRRGNSSTDFSMTLLVPGSGSDAAMGFKAALELLENGETTIRVETVLTFPNAIGNVRHIESAYEAVCAHDPLFHVPETCGNAENWKRLLGEISEKTPIWIPTDMYAPDRSYGSWRSFINWKQSGADGSRPYLAYVLEKTEHFEDFDANILNLILDFDPEDERFPEICEDRKSLLQNFPEAELAGFLARAKIKGKNRIYYLTANTEAERKAIIECLSEFEELPEGWLKKHYTDLADYLREFMFDCGELGKPFRNYFADYRRQKVSNRIDENFLKIVWENAQKRKYNLLSTRDAVLDQIDRTDTELFWVDALGVEFLGFIQTRCAELGLGLSVKIVRSALPTITAQNKNSYENWTGRKHIVKELDKLKHSGEDGYDYTQTKRPVHLAKELVIVRNVLERAKTELTSGHVQKIVVTSDHGASRLVVVNGQELQYEVDSRGEHSGRCCAICDLQGLNCVTVENGWLVLADYGRFKGGRAAAVEVHGGATWEEVLVPVIELTLPGRKIEIQLVNGTIIADYRTPAVLELFSTSNLYNVSVVVKGKRYETEKVDENHHQVILPNIKRPGDYVAEVFEGDNLVGNLNFTVKSGVGGENDLL
jgi:hypothetical protein